MLDYVFGQLVGQDIDSVISDEACFGLSFIWAGLEGVKGGSDRQRVYYVFGFGLGQVLSG